MAGGQVDTDRFLRQDLRVAGRDEALDVLSGEHQFVPVVAGLGQLAREHERGNGQNRDDEDEEPPVHGPIVVDGCLNDASGAPDGR